MSARSSGQRIFIWVIVIAFVVSSLGFTGLVIWDMTRSNDDTSQDTQTQLDQQSQEQQMQKEPLTGFNAEPFNKEKVTDLKVETLKQGDGKAAAASSTVSANYFGWTSDGKIFDSSQKGGTATPVEFPLSGVIPGWTEGLTGVKAGSVVKLTIPAEKAYGEQGSPPVIGPNEPLVFIVELKEVK